MGEAKQIEAEARGYGERVQDDRPEDYPWPSDREMRDDAEREQ